MKFSQAAVCIYSLTSCVSAAALPNTNSLSIRDTFAELVPVPFSNPLEKRKGGGGGGGKGGGSTSSSGSSSSGEGSSGSGSSSGSSGSSGSGSSSSGSGSSGSSGSSSGSSGSSGSSSGSGTKGLGSTSSNTGGRTTGGSGVAPSYGGGRYYGGGATTPYSSGGRSPLGITPLLLLAPALAFGGLWAYGAYSYPYSHPYNFHNESSNNSTNTTLPVQCLCAQYSECGCDDNNNTSYLDGLVGNGSASDMNSTLARVADVNGTRTLLINGTLPNGTTASGGTASASSGARTLAELSGWWMTIGIVSYIVWFI